MTTKKLLVEGKDDKWAVINLMRAYIAWGIVQKTWPVVVEEYEGVPKLFEDGYLSLQLKASNAQWLGILIDADDDAAAKWSAIRNRCMTEFPLLPMELPATGIISNNDKGQWLGVWIMPDNRSRGMLETFLAKLCAKSPPELWDLAVKSCTEAKNRGAPFAPVHFDKATIHAWLAWQDPPGLPFGTAIHATCLNAASPDAEPFVTWFRTFYQL